MAKDAVASVKGNKYVGGIVGYMDRGKIISCENGVPVTGNSYVGGIAGGINYLITIQDCSNSGIIKVADGGSYLGGIAGGAETGLGASYITNCHNEGNIGEAGTGRYAAGIIGFSRSTLTIQNCTSAANISGLTDVSTIYNGTVSAGSNV